jgi:ferrous iron transport protein A
MPSLPKRPEGHRTRTEPSTAKERSADACPLDRAPRDCELEVVEIDGGLGALRQLANLGILTGAILQVRRAAPLGGPVLVEIRGSTVAVGRGVARKVLVRMVQ